MLLTYCGYEGGVEGVLAESEQQTCLSDSTVSDEQQFEEIIVRFRHLKHTADSKYVSVIYCKAVAVQRNPPSGNHLSCLAADWQQTGAPRYVTSRFALHYGLCSSIESGLNVVFSFF